MHPCYAERLAPFRSTAKHRYVPATGDCTRIQRGDVSLFLTIDEQGSIVKARHLGGTGDVEAVLEAFCSSIEGQSISEARAHGALQLEYALRSPLIPPPVTGLITPENADPAFAVLLDLTHQIPQNESSRSRIKRSAAPAAALLVTMVREELSRSGYMGPEVDIQPTGSPNRWLITFSNGNAPPDFFLRLLSLESRVRARTLADIELFVEGKEDRNQRDSRDPRINNLHPGA